MLPVFAFLGGGLLGWAVTDLYRRWQCRQLPGLLAIGLYAIAVGINVGLYQLCAMLKVWPWGTP